MVVVDYYSRFFEIELLKTLTEREVIDICKKLFSRYGIPEIVRTDNGTQFASEFKKFASAYDFVHVTSSPCYAQSNGSAEAAVKIAKNLVKKADDINLALLAYRTTPLENGFSPAEMMFSRRVRSTLPLLSSELGTFVEHNQVKARETSNKNYQEQYYNKRHRTKNLPSLKENEKVWITDRREYGTIVDHTPFPNSYLVNTSRGMLRRNRRHLISCNPKTRQERLNSSDAPIIEIDLTKDANENVHASENLPSLTGSGRW